MKAIAKFILISICIKFSIQANSQDSFLIYDAQLSSVVNEYRAFGGDSFSYLVYPTPFDLVSLAAENVTHIRKDYSNIHFDETTKAYKIFRSKHSWTLNRLKFEAGVYKPIEFVASCRKSFGTDETLCNYKKNINGLGFQFTLDSNNMHLAEDVLVGLYKITTN